MKWIDYREALNLGFSDSKKIYMLAAKIATLLDEISEKEYDCEHSICRRYYSEIGEMNSDYDFYEVKKEITNQETSLDMISHVVAFSLAAKKEHNSVLADMITNSLKRFLDELNICYELFIDEDGTFVFPKGANELDEGNINIPYEWLRQYPDSRKAMTIALRSYACKEQPSVVADLFRKTLETFGKEFLKVNRSLENQKNEFGRYLKGKGVPPSLCGNFETILQMYTNFMNEYAKHNDKTSEKYLEFIMYHTGNIIRFVLSLSDGNIANSDL